MANLINLLAQTAWNTGFWGKIIGWFYGGIGNYVWTIIIVTIVLKLVLSPMEFFQRKVTKKNADMQKIMQPELDRVRSKYQNQPDKLQQKLNEKQMELYKKHNYNIVGSCFIMLINMVLTMVVFITLLSSLNTIANIQNANQFDALRTEYETVIEVNGDKAVAESAKQLAITDAKASLDELYNSLVEAGFSSEDALKQRTESENKIGADAYRAALIESVDVDVMNKALQDKYREVKESWLWVKNVWKSDTATSPVPSYNEYLTLSNTSEEVSEAEYRAIMEPIKKIETGWNGYYILVILSGAVLLIAQMLMSGDFKKKTPEEKAAMKKGLFMKILLPGLMVFITFTSNAVFAAYVVVNSLVGMAITPLYNLIINAIDKHKEKKVKDAVVVDYRRK